MSPYSHLEDDFNTLVLSNGYKTNFIALFFFKGKGGAANIDHSQSHSFIEFIHCLSIKCTQFLSPFQSTWIHSNAAESPGGEKHTERETRPRQKG